MRTFSVTELPSDTLDLARFLLGQLLIRNLPEGVIGGRIVETEAYPPGDPAAHHYRRITPRNRSLFLPLGHAYVYRAYGSCWMLNVASESAGIGAGVLIRALEPEIGVAAMAARRGGVVTRDIARGPGRLAASLAIDRTLDGIDLCQPAEFLPPLRIAADSRPREPIGAGPRIGISRAVEAPWRFYLRGNRFVSGPAWLSP